MVIADLPTPPEPKTAMRYSIEVRGVICTSLMKAS